jgi:formate-nitrite transporter family protein
MADSKGAHAPTLDAQEEKKAEEEESLNADVTHTVVQREGEKQLERTSMALAWSALAAGMSMGFSLVAEGLLHAHLPDATWRPIISKLGYTVGFLIVTLASQELFTEHTVESMVPLFARRTRRLLRNVARIWGITLAANLAGALIFAALLAYTTVFDPHVKETFVRLGLEAIDHPTGTIFVRGVFAGWLIALMVWMIPAASSSSVLITIIMTWLVGLAGLAHIVAGSVEIMLLALLGNVTWADYLQWATPAVLGNAIGGVVFVSMLNHLQVAAGKKYDTDANKHHPNIIT